MLHALRSLAVFLILLAGAARAAETKPFAREDMASDAVRLTETLRAATAAIGAQVKGKTPQQLLSEAARAVSGGDFVTADKLAGAAIIALVALVPRMFAPTFPDQRGPDSVMSPYVAGALLNLAVGAILARPEAGPLRTAAAAGPGLGDQRVNAAAIEQLDPQPQHPVGTGAEFTDLFTRVAQQQRAQCLEADEAAPIGCGFHRHAEFFRGGIFPVGLNVVCAQPPSSAKTSQKVPELSAPLRKLFMRITLELWRRGR